MFTFESAEIKVKDRNVRIILSKSDITIISIGNTVITIKSGKNYRKIDMVTINEQ